MEDAQAVRGFRVGALMSAESKSAATPEGKVETRSAPSRTEVQFVQRFTNCATGVITTVYLRTDDAYIVVPHDSQTGQPLPGTHILWDREAAFCKAREIAGLGTLNKLGAGPLEREPETDAPLVRELLGALYDCVETLEYVRRYVQAVRIPDLVAVLSRAREVMARTESRK